MRCPLVRSVTMCKWVHKFVAPFHGSCSNNTVDPCFNLSTRLESWRLAFELYLSETDLEGTSESSEVINLLSFALRARYVTSHHLFDLKSGTFVGTLLLRSRCPRFTIPIASMILIATRSRDKLPKGTLCIHQSPHFPVLRVAFLGHHEQVDVQV